MARVQRFHVHGGIYYVQLRVNADGPLFPGPNDQREFESLVARALARSHAQMHAYAWLRTSANMLVQVDALPLGRIIQAIAGPYAKIVNRRLGQRGHRFEHPHGATLVQPSDVLDIALHLHHMAFNSDSGRASSTEPNSSHTAYLGERLTPWLTRDAVHGLLRARGETPQAGYRKLIRKAEPSFQTVHVAGDRRAGEQHLSEVTFVHWLAERTRPPKTSLHEVIDVVARRLGIAPSELGSISRRRYLSFARALIAWYATNERIATLTEVARHFERDPSTLSSGIARYKQQKPEYFQPSLDRSIRGTLGMLANNKDR